MNTQESNIKIGETYNGCIVRAVNSYGLKQAGPRIMLFSFSICYSKNEDGTGYNLYHNINPIHWFGGLTGICNFLDRESSTHIRLHRGSCDIPGIDDKYFDQSIPEEKPFEPVIIDYLGLIKLDLLRKENSKLSDDMDKRLKELRDKFPNMKFTFPLGNPVDNCKDAIIEEQRMRIENLKNGIKDIIQQVKSPGRGMSDRDGRMIAIPNIENLEKLLKDAE